MKIWVSPLQHCPLPDQDTDTSICKFSRKHHLHLSFRLSLVDGPHITHLPRKVFSECFSHFTSSFRAHPGKTLDSDMFPLYTGHLKSSENKQLGMFPWQEVLLNPGRGIASIFSVLLSIHLHFLWVRMLSSRIANTLWTPISSSSIMKHIFLP